MWPIMLDMTRDECRGILRRLELEAYSTLMSSFRAQGGLNEKKQKMLDELRSLLHISIDRHRAESRRVANDEQLCTIAEVLSGPNTLKDWAKEGERPHPLIYRGAALTAFNIYADQASEAVLEKNSSLPFPAETRRGFVVQTNETDKNIVVQDPISITAIDEKVNFKRPMACANMDDESFPEPKREKLSPVKIHTNAKIRQLYKKCTKYNVAESPSKSKTTPSKRGKGKASVSRSEKAERKNKKTAAQPLPDATKCEIIPPTVVQQSTQVVPASPVSPTSPSSILQATVFEGQVFIPQIATSKKDIASNLTKLISNVSPQPVTIKSLNISSTNTDNKLMPPPPAPPSSLSSLTTNVKVPVTVSYSDPTAQKPQQIIKMIPSKSIKISNNILHKSLSGNIINPNFEVGSKINFQFQNSPHNKIVMSSPPSINSNLVPPFESQPSYKMITTSKIANEVVQQKFTPKLQPQQVTPAKGNYKVQILSQQILQSPSITKTMTQIQSPTVATPVKAGSSIDLKGLQPKSQLKLVSSPTGGLGKVVLKSATPGTKIANFTQIKSAQNVSSPRINTITTLNSLQKVQIMPMGSKTTSAMTNESGKNVIVMQKLNQMSAVTPLRGVKLSKDLNKIILNTKNVTRFKTTTTATTTASNQNNVIVLGISEAMPAEKCSSANVHLSKSSVITEDTPVDIVQSLPSPNSAGTEIIINGSVEAMSTSPATMTVMETNTDWEMELDQANTLRKKSSPPRKNQTKKGGGKKETVVEEMVRMDVSVNDDDDLENMLQDGLEATSPQECRNNVIEDGEESNEEDRLTEKLIFEVSNDDDYIVEDHTIEDQPSTINETFDESGGVIYDKFVDSLSSNQSPSSQEDDVGTTSTNVDEVEAMMTELHSTNDKVKSAVDFRMIASQAQLDTAEILGLNN